MENLILKRLTEEISGELANLEVARVRGTPPYSLHVELKAAGRDDRRFLTISLDPHFPALFALEPDSLPASPGRPGTQSRNVLSALAEVPAGSLPEGFVDSLSMSLQGTTLGGIQQLNLDRVARVSFYRATEGECRVLWIELFGRIPNAVLVEPSADEILACSREGITSTSGGLLRPGETYVPPGAGDKVSAESLSHEALDSLIREPGSTQLALRLSRRIRGLSPQAASAILEGLTSPPEPPETGALLESLRGILLRSDVPLQPTVRSRHRLPRGAFDVTLRPFGSGSQDQNTDFAVQEFETASDAVRFAYSELCHWYRIQSAAKIRRQARLVLESLSRLQDSLKADMTSAEKAEDFRRKGELILAGLKDIKRGSATLEGVDIHADGRTPIEVELDPSISPLQNAERYFKKARKADRARERVRRRLDSIQRALEAAKDFGKAIPEDLEASEAALLVRKLNRFIHGLRTRKTVDLRRLRLPEVALDEAKKGRLVDAMHRPQALGTRRPFPVEKEDVSIDGARDRSGLVPNSGIRHRKPERKTEATLNPRVLETSDGFTLLVGRNNRENDHVTYHVAGPEDLWFHASGMPGSHVVLKRRGKSEPSRKAIEEAASVAAYYSKGRTSSSVPVIYTKRKYVHKPKGGRPGVATYSREKFLMARPLKPGRSS
jgi:predicted ribosome quality control (RQC) complex YloA/Tae2 family protein